MTCEQFRQIALLNISSITRAEIASIIRHKDGCLECWRWSTTKIWEFLNTLSYEERIATQVAAAQHIANMMNDPEAASVATGGHDD